MICLHHYSNIVEKQEEEDDDVVVAVLNYIENRKVKLGESLMLPSITPIKGTFATMLDGHEKKES